MDSFAQEMFASLPLPEDIEEALHHDVISMIAAYECQHLVIPEPVFYKIAGLDCHYVQTTLRNENNLYRHLVIQLRESGAIHLLNEILPMIDDYIEYVFR